MDKIKSLFLLPAVILLGVLYYFRPWIHSLLLAIYVNPYIIQAALVSIGIGVFVHWKIPRKSAEDDEIPVQAEGISSTAATAIFLVIFVIGGVANNAYTNVTMAEDLQQDYTEIETLPDVDNENPRILPRSVADEFAENSLQEPRHKLADSDIAISEDGTPKWTYPLQPDGAANTFLINQKGAAYADMTTSSSNISYNNQEMDVGVGMQIRDNINWVQPKNKYWVNYEDHFVLEHEGDNYIATPYIEYDFGFKFPIVYTVPEWGGMALTDNEGNIEYIDSEEVQRNEILQNQRNYPFELANQYVSAMEYREGIINQWFFHENQLEVAPVPGFDNDQPFMILTEDNPELFVATEPFGDASGLFEIWTIDGVTGEYELYRLERDEGLIGANRAVNFVRQANERVNWANIDEDTGFSPIEPLPVIVNDELYWQVRVVPVDGAGVAFTSFVNADTSNVYTAQDDDDLVEFLEGEETDEAIEDVEETTEDLEDLETHAVTSEGVEIAIIEDGEVVDMVETESMDFDIEIRE